MILNEYQTIHVNNIVLMTALREIVVFIRSIEIQLYWNYRPILRTRTVSSIAQTIF